MAEWVTRHWIPQDGSGVSRKARRGGDYRAFLPDTLIQRTVQVPADLSRKLSRVEREIRELSDGESGTPTGSGLEGFSRFLLRSEAISSSRIEGIAPRPDKVAISELLQVERHAGAQDIARLVANNVSVLQGLSRQLRQADELGLDDIIAAQYLLLANPRVNGIRERQNWIGGDDYSPLEADFVPPPPEAVPDLMADLITYLNGATHGALIQAALTHAQFETIHPFPDGNGRIGRALIHVVLQRRGLTRSPILPVSMVLGTLSYRYVDGLTRFRESDEGVVDWISIFVDAAEEAVVQARRLAGELTEIRAEWDQRILDHRSGQGRTRALRSDSLVAKLLAVLPDRPVLTAKVAAEAFGRTPTATARALDELAQAGILRKRSIGKGVTGYLADDVFDLITDAERRLASTRFNTKLSPPGARAVPDPRP